MVNIENLTLNLVNITFLKGPYQIPIKLRLGRSQIMISVFLLRSNLRFNHYTLI